MSAGRIAFQPTSNGHSAEADFDTFAGGGLSKLSSQINAGLLDSGTFAINTNGSGATFNVDDSFGGGFTQKTTPRSPSGISGTPGLFPLMRSSNDSAVIIRPDIDNVSPGTFYARFYNNTGTALGNLTVSLDFLSTNDKDNGFSLTTSYATMADDGSTAQTTDAGLIYTPVAAASFVSVSPNASDSSVTVQPLTSLLPGASLPSGESIVFSFRYDPIGTGRSFDAFGFDNIRIDSAAGVTAVPEPLAAGGLAVLSGILLRRDRP